MAVRAFSGTSWIRFPGINTTGAFSWLGLIKMMDTTVPSGWQAVASSANSSAVSQVTQYVRGTAGTGAPQQGRVTTDITGVGSQDGVTAVITNPATWKIFGITKATGSSTPRVHIFPLGGAWTHENQTGNLSNPSAHASGRFYIGAYGDSGGVLGDFCNMRMALYGVWNGTALSDVQVEALATGLATSAWTGHAVTPTAVWEFTQVSTGTSVSDLVGSNHQVDIAGTSVETTDDPSGWTFASGGATPTIPTLTVAPYRPA